MQKKAEKFPFSDNLIVGQTAKNQLGMSAVEKRLAILCIVVEIF